jgi:3-oxoacyl-ACP reductase-like protein
MHGIYKANSPQKIKLDSLHTAFGATFMFYISRLLQQRLKCGPQKNILSTTLQRSYLQFQRTVYLQPARSTTSLSVNPLTFNMSSLYDQSIPVMIKYLNNASKMLDKAAAYADEKGMKHEDILTFRLRDDMRP